MESLRRGWGIGGLVLLAGLLSLLVLLPAVQAGTTGKIAGTVVDASTGEPIPAANVVVEGTNRGAATDLDGQYYIINLQPGTYDITVSSLGYATKTLTGVEVSIDKTRTLDVKLDPAAIQGETVTIVAKKPIIEVDRTFATSSVSAEDFEAMPITRVQEAIDLQAGVVDGHFRGGRSGEVVYMVDGIPVQDSYDNSQATTLNQGAVQELQVISGTFNAEYGQAMSGVVNLVTKEGGTEYHGQLMTQFGDYLSTHDDVFYNIDDVNPIHIQNYEASLSGPVPMTNNKLSFFANARWDDNDGWLYGQRRWANEHILPGVGNLDLAVVDSLFRDPNDTLLTGPSPFPDDYDFQHGQAIYDEYGFIPVFGDNKAQSMNPDQNIYLFGKVTWDAADKLKINYSTIWEDREWKDYDHEWKYVPNGILNKMRHARTNMLRATYTFGQSAFLESGYSNTFSEFKEYLYEDPFDPRYTDPFWVGYLNTGVTLNIAGVNFNRFRRFTDTHSIQSKLNWQLNKTHYLVTGVEAKFNTISYSDFRPITGQGQDSRGSTLFENSEEYDQAELFEGYTENTGTLLYDRYFNNPFEAAAFIQDKIEMENFILNVGLRLDYFDPDGRVLADPADPNINAPLLPERRDDPFDERKGYWYEDVQPKWQLSPRLGIAYPISPTGVLHFAYGHFFQRPRYEYLYANPEFEIEPGSTLNTLMGNADLEAEKTISYEFGLQQGITDDLAMNVSLYQRDIRNLVSSDMIISTYDAGTKYTKYVNRDFGEVRGIVLSLDKRYANGISGQLNYTFQVAEGNASNPTDAFNAAKGDQEPIKILLPLDWDRRHTINATVNYFQPDVFGASMIAYYGSGLPYTSQNKSSDAQVLVAFENDARKPAYFNVDLNAFYYLPFFKGTGIRATVELMVRNLFDRLNENDVYPDTGTAEYTIDQLRNQEIEAGLINSLDEVYNQPQRYSRPREVRIGLKLNF